MTCIPRLSSCTEKPAAKATYKTFDGLVVQIDGFKKDDKRFVAITLSYDAALAEQFKVKTDADAKATTRSDPAAEPHQCGNKDVEEEAKQSAGKLGDWVYEIAGYKYDSIFRPIDETAEEVVLLLRQDNHSRVRPTVVPGEMLAIDPNPKVAEADWQPRHERAGQALERVDPRQQRTVLANHFEPPRHHAQASARGGSKTNRRTRSRAPATTAGTHIPARRNALR